MKIIISNIPGDFPSGYSEQIYLDTRSVRIGKDHTIIETAKPHRVLNDQTYRKRKIQSVFYDKYTLELLATESIDIDRVNMANTISIVQDSGEIHSAELIDFEDATRMQDSEFRLYNLTYRNLDSKHTVNYISSDSIASTRKAYYKFKNQDTETFTEINTTLNLNFDISPYEFTENDDNGLKLISSENSFKVVEFMGYVTEDQKNNIQRFTNFTNLDNLSIYDYSDSTWTEYSALEIPEVIIDDADLEGLYPITIRLRYNQTLSYPYGISITASPDNYEFGLGGGSKDITITYEGIGDWEVQSNPSWMTLVKSAGNLNITVAYNPDERIGSIILKSTEDLNVTETIEIIQT